MDTFYAIIKLVEFEKGAGRVYVTCVNPFLEPDRNNAH